MSTKLTRFMIGQKIKHEYFQRRERPSRVMVRKGIICRDCLFTASYSGGGSNKWHLFERQKTEIG